MAGITNLFRKTAAPAAPPALPVTAAAAILPLPTVAIPAAAPNTGSASYPAEFASNIQPTASQVIDPSEIVTVNQLPLKTFLGDILIPGGGVITTIDIYGQMGSNCVGFNLLQLSLPALVNINGGGFRTVPSDMVVDESIITSLQIQNFGTNSVLQLNGV